MLPPPLIDMSPLISRIVRPRSATVCITKKACIRQYPSRAYRRFASTITLGDMHGNPMKLLWSLIHEGVIEMSAESFARMWEIYENLNVDHESTLQNKGPEELLLLREKNLYGLRAFLSLLGAIKVVDAKLKVRLLGDLFAERGCNDYLTLRILEKLHKGGVKPEIVCSNHDSWLLENYKIRALRKWQFINVHSQQNSLLGLFLYIKWGIVEQAEVERLVETYVIPYMKPIAYALSADGNTIDLFMHAPNDFDVIKELAEELHLASGVEYDTTSAIGLSKTIDAINEMFQRLSSEQSEAGPYRNILKIASYTSDVINKNQLSKEQFFKYLDMKGLGYSENEKKAGFFLGKLIWNRLPATNGCINFKTYPNCVSHVVHGHTKVGSWCDNRQMNLDSYLGKDSGENEGAYNVFCTIEYSMSKIVKQVEDVDTEPLLAAMGSPSDIFKKQASAADDLTLLPIIESRRSSGK